MRNLKMNMNSKLYYILPKVVAGRICNDPRGGFVWVPFSTANQRSRKAWPTPEAAIKGRISGGKFVKAVTIQQACALAEQFAKEAA